MKAQTIAVKESTGRVLTPPCRARMDESCWPKAHLLTEEDARLVECEGFHRIAVVHIESGEVGEDDAVMRVASETRADL
jgi:hypothetical protein